jgi:hypothetical protein
MDPFVEPHWLDVHTALIGEARRALNRSLPAGLIARVEERVAVESDDDVMRRIGPDVRVFSPSTADPAEGRGGVVIEAPYKLVTELDPIIERFIRVIDEAGRLITVIEFISPTNKRSPGLEVYREKRIDLLRAGVHVVEVDLVRAGDWRALLRPEVSPAEAISIYRATVRTSGVSPGAYLFPIRLQDQLPKIPVPLREGDGVVRLPLQELFDSAYEDGRYDRALDYSRPLDPPLERGDAEWVEEMLEKSGARGTN